MKYVLLPLLLLACGDKEEDSATEAQAPVEELEQENEAESSEETE